MALKILKPSVVIHVSWAFTAVRVCIKIVETFGV